MPRLDWFFYVSHASDAITAEQVQEIHRVSRDRNTQAGLTGRLLFSGGHFAQVLEGDSSPLEQVIGAIRKDSRHHGMRVLAHEPCASRRFADWSLSYVGNPGTADLLDQLLSDPSVSLSRAERLLASLFAYESEPEQPDP